MRLVKPTGSGFASMHAKCWIIDGHTLLSGSLNLTHGGLDHNVEHLFKITDQMVVNQALCDFERHWADAEPVTQAEIDRMQEKWDKTHVKRERSGSRSVSRSLSQELELQGQDNNVRIRSFGDD